MSVKECAEIRLLPHKGGAGRPGRLRSKQMRVEIGGNGVAYRDEALHVVFAQSVDLAQSQAQREGSLHPLQGEGLGRGQTK